MFRWISAVVAAAALIGTGIVHGYWSDRWSPDRQVADAADQLGSIPMQIGEWEGKDLEVKPGQAGPGVTGCLQRSYFNRRLGVSVTIALVNGRPGPVAIHTPEVCYGASGYLVGKREPVQRDKTDDAAHFWTADAVRSRVTEETRIRLFWAWNGGEGWKAANDARVEFPRGRHPVLHKLYVLRELTGPASRARDKEEPCAVFLDALLPVLDRTLFARRG